jgi:hypothetical protein
MTQPHAFRPLKPGSTRCSACGGWADQPCHSLELFTDTDRDREAARGLAEAAQMTATLRTPMGNVSCQTGNLEQRSPLWYGTDSQPALF